MSYFWYSDIAVSQCITVYCWELLYMLYHALGLGLGLDLGLDLGWYDLVRLCIDMRVHGACCDFDIVLCLSSHCD